MRLFFIFAFGIASCLWVRASPGGASWNFGTDIVPVLTKAGCNAGACHGASSGQGNFRLSLLGYDPEEDFWNISREFAGRRIDLDSPEASLVLRKPSRQLDHEGGRKLPRGSSGYETLLHWIQEGAPYGSSGARVTAIEVTPSDCLFPEPGAQTQLKVTATLSDGAKRDVTALVLYSSNDDAMAEANREGLVTMRGRGLTSVMIRFSGQVAAVRVAVPFDGTGQSPNLSRNFIDDEINAELARLRIPASPLSNDAEFLRRVSLDITGTLPSPEKARVWNSSSSQDRGQLIDGLLGSPEFVDFWTMKLADLLLIGGKSANENATAVYNAWLREQIVTNAGWNVIAQALVDGAGDITRDGPANFLTLASDPRDMAEYAGDIFLGTRIGCARCHAHPTDRWTRDDYYKFAAFFAPVAHEGNFIARKEQATIEHPKTKKPLGTKLLGGAEVTSTGRSTAILAKWMTEPGNPFFARAMVNRIWKQLLGRGLVEPVNDLRPTNPATHTKLLEHLAERFAANHYDLRWLIKTIASSAAYQRSSSSLPGNAVDDRFYARAYPKPLPAQVLIDAISEVTGVPEKFGSAAPGARATQLIGAQTPSYALDVLGRCSRQRACEPASESGGGLAQALHLINGATINGKLSGGALSAFLSTGKANAELIEEFYYRALARPPVPDEREWWERSFATSTNRTEAAEDFLWALLNSREFSYNH